MAEPGAVTGTGAGLMPAGLLPASGLRRPRPAFALTPLADVMFQLLIFFMLSSSLAPYALLSLDEAAPPPDETAGDSAQDTADTAGDMARAVSPRNAVWQLGRDEVRAGGQRIPLADIGPALDDLAQRGVAEVVILTTAAARTADLVAVLERIRARGAGGRGGAPLTARIVGGAQTGPVGGGGD